MPDTKDGLRHYRGDEIEIDEANCRIRVPDLPNWIDVNKDQFNNLPEGRIVEVRLGACEHGAIQVTFGIADPEEEMCDKKKE